jgi:fatty-acyl-CoA synthase
MIWHFANMFEQVAARVPDRLAVVEGATRRTWRDYEERAARLAGALAAAGIGPDAKVALYGHNSAEFLEAQFATFKARAVPINVNYRYVEEELAYLFDNADVEAVFFDARFAPRLAAIRDRLPGLKLFVQIEDGSGESLPGALDYEALVAASPRLPQLDYSEDDIYMIYTGGTTGMPKGVMYRHGDFTRAVAGFKLGAEVEPSLELLLTMVDQIAAAGPSPVVLPACPLMHGTGMWLGAFGTHAIGGTVALLRDEKFDPHRIWSHVAENRINGVVIVGDAFAKPMLGALRDAAAGGAPPMIWGR